MELRSGHGGLGTAGDFRLCHAGTVLLVGRRRRERLLVCTGDSYLVALDPDSGKPILDFGDNGRTDLTQGSRRPLIRKLVNCSAPPTIVGDVAVVGNQIADGPPGKSARSGGAHWKDNWPVGDVRGYDVRSGKRLWTFHTIPQEGEFGVETWGNESWKWDGQHERLGR